MRYLLLTFFAVLLLLAMMRFGDLSVAAQVALALGCSAFFGRYLWVGFRTETMEAPGVGYLAGHRTDNPILFWFCTAFNAVMLVLTVIIAAKLAGL
ncbi:MAG: hypothetical protein C0520_15120 [Sphingopyxis sp.]|nr:hypothetical protein [Sphingopyxis sp.]